MKRSTRLLATIAVLALTLWSSHEIAPDHPHDLAAYANSAQYVVSLAGGELAEVHSIDCYQQVTVHDRNWTDVVCGAAWTPTSLPATATTVPSTPTAVPSETIEGIPLCTDHDPTKWHALVKRDANNTIVCTYGHEHHDDPNAVNDIFGPPSAWYGGTQEISYPWMTHNADGDAENTVKHEGYKWYVARDLPCLPANPTQDPGCIVSYRVQVHTLGTAADAVVRFHSFGVEELVDYKGQRGIVRHGGYMDSGHLRLLVDQGGKGDVVCEPPGVLPNDKPFSVCDSGPTREHSGANVPAPHTGHNIYTPNWYTQNAMITVQPKLEEWGPIDYADPFHQLFFPSSRPDGQVAGGFVPNNSRGRIENFTTNVAQQRFLIPFANAQRIVNYSGYTDPLAAPSSCTAPGPICVPLQIEGVYSNSLYYLSAAISQVPPITTMVEHDVKSPVTGRSLIRFPN